MNSDHEPMKISLMIPKVFAGQTMGEFGRIVLVYIQYCSEVWGQ